MNRYEGMFLFDPGVVRDWSAIEGEIKRLMDRIGAAPLVCVKFDERKLAYEIEKRKRGIYVLTYFDADPARITDLERDARLSELVLRALVLRAENLTEEKLAQLQAHPAETPLSPMSGEGRGRHEDEPRGREGRERRGREGRDRRDDRDGRSRDDFDGRDADEEKGERPRRRVEAGASDD